MVKLVTIGQYHVYGWQQDSWINGPVSNNVLAIGQHFLVRELKPQVHVRIYHGPGQDDGQPGGHARHRDTHEQLPGAQGGAGAGAAARRPPCAPNARIWPSVNTAAFL